MENEPGPSGSEISPPNPRRGIRNLRTIVLDDTTFEDDQVQPDGEVYVITEPTNGAVRRIESSGEEESDGEVKKKKKRYNSEAKEEEDTRPDDSEDSVCCSICFEEFTNAGSHRLVCLKCGHVFGQSCIEKWIRSEKNSKCPQCKARARIADIRRIFARTIKMTDTTELEMLRESLKTYKAENENLRIEITELKLKLQHAVDMASTAVENPVQGEFRSSTGRALFLPSVLRAGPNLIVSNDSGSRYVDASGDFVVVTCSMHSGLFLPYGLKLITKDVRVKTAVPVHTKKPRCCVFSPFDNSLVLSTGEDKTLCITSFGDTATVLYRFELPANGWSCCWLNEDEVAVGLVNGKVLKFEISNNGTVPSELTDVSSRYPIIGLQWISRASSLIVASIRECCVYRHQQKTSIAFGSLMSFCWNARNDCFMLSFSPSGSKLFTEHALYKADSEGGELTVREVDRYQSQSNKQTRMIHCILWDIQDSLFSAVFDETHSQLVVFNWEKERRVVGKNIHDDIIAIKELRSQDETKFRLACLSERRLHFFDLQCS